jgi:prepilin signal peptidase PulO-like enzyme (type II secretory pathway)
MIALSLLVVLVDGFHRDAIVGILLVAVLVMVSQSDLERRIIPNRIVIPAWLAALVLNTGLHPNRWAEWLLASLVAGLVFLILALAYPDGLGMGDVKLVLLLGAALGWHVVPALMIGTGTAAVVSALILMRHGLQARKRTIPLGPFLAIGALIELLL